MPKTIRRNSGMTSFRTATPSSPELAKQYMNFRFNHLTQRNVRPNRLGCASEGFTTPNPDGAPATSANAKTGQPLGGDANDFFWPPCDPGQTKV